MSIIMTADIGGTNCRFGLYSLENSTLRLDDVRWISTGDIPHTSAFLEAIEATAKRTLTDIDIVVTAIAGPVTGNNCGQLSNGALELDFRKYANNIIGPSFWLINDFMAQAYAVMQPENNQTEQLWAGEPADPASVRGVIGAGTGLGYATVVPFSPFLGRSGRMNIWRALPSENGHVVFPFVNRDEYEFHKFLRRKLHVPHATGDDVLSGRGLALLHLFLTGKEMTAPEVGASAMASETETLIWFSRFYGRACRHWMLTTLCSGGLWIAGGIAAQNPLTVKNAAFFEELHGNPKWEKMLKTIPVFLIMDKNSGLWGAAKFGQQILEEESTASL